MYVQGLCCATGGWLLDGKLSQSLVVGGISGGEVMRDSRVIYKAWLILILVTAVTHGNTAVNI